MSTVAVEQTPEERQMYLMAEAALARLHPCLFLRHVTAVDTTTGEDFHWNFSPQQLLHYATSKNEVTKRALPRHVAEQMLSHELSGDYEETGWEWQGDMIDWWCNEFVTCVLKARQLGVTWCAAGVGLWFITQLSGTKVLCQSIGEDEAADIIDHAWELYQSLLKSKPHLLGGLTLTRPTGGRRPHREIEFMHANGRTSQFQGVPATTAKGHGRTASFVIMDEFARHPYAKESYKAMIPTQAGSNSSSGRTAIISTGNGISTDEESGNYFHYVWTHARNLGVKTKFLRWDTNPDRDERWYQRVATKLPHRDRGEQYPRDEVEAFILTGDTYFAIEDLLWYMENHARPSEFSFDWEVLPGEQRARQRRNEFGSTSVFLEPQKGHSYAMAVDVATGYGKDFSCAYVIDLSSSAFVAECHAKMDAEAYAEQIHFLGKWYNHALIAVEKGGGYGEMVITPLRDGKNNRPPYRKLYRHSQPTSINPAEQARTFGFPITRGTRMHAISLLEQALREKSLPWCPTSLLQECQTFVYRKVDPSPAAADGCNDDRVMSASIALELFRRYGSHPDVRPKAPIVYEEPYPWR